MQNDHVIETTLLNLVQSITATDVNEETVVATVVTLVRSGQVHLTGNFRGIPASVLFPPSGI